MTCDQRKETEDDTLLQVYVGRILALYSIT